MLAFYAVYLLVVAYQGNGVAGRSVPLDQPPKSGRQLEGVFGTNPDDSGIDMFVDKTVAHCRDPTKSNGISSYCVNLEQSRVVPVLSTILPPPPTEPPTTTPSTTPTTTVCVDDPTGILDRCSRVDKNHTDIYPTNFTTASYPTKQAANATTPAWTEETQRPNGSDGNADPTIQLDPELAQYTQTWPSVTNTAAGTTQTKSSSSYPDGQNDLDPRRGGRNMDDNV